MEAPGPQAQKLNTQGPLGELAEQMVEPGGQTPLLGQQQLENSDDMAELHSQAEGSSPGEGAFCDP